MIIPTTTRPTISILLPTHNRCWTLGRQIEAVLPQLLDGDELIVIANGCTDQTLAVVDLLENSRMSVRTFSVAMGVCGGYNAAAMFAETDWVLGANDHNELSPFALNHFRLWAQSCPTARLMFGHIDAMQRVGYIEGGGFVDPVHWPAIWAVDGMRTHGAAAFIRRDSWGVGYRPELEWMADHEQTMTLAIRHGCVDIPELISHVEFRRGNYSQAHADPVLRAKVLRAWRALIDTPEFEDVREQYLIFDRITGHFSNLG